MLAVTLASLPITPHDSILSALPAMQPELPIRGSFLAGRNRMSSGASPMRRVYNKKQIIHYCVLEHLQLIFLFFSHHRSNVNSYVLQAEH